MIHTNYHYHPNTFLLKAEMYKELASNPFQALDEVQIALDYNGYGWIDMHIWVNGEEKTCISLSNVFDPIPDIKHWLEQIVNDNNFSAAIEIEEEGPCSTLVFERLKQAEVGSTLKNSASIAKQTIPFWHVNDLYTRDNDKWLVFDAENHFDYGLFYLYNNSGEIPVKAIVKTKDLVRTIYCAFLDYALCTTYKAKNKDHVFQEWAGDKNSDNWTFYNEFKSQLVEWNLTAKKGYRHEHPKFQKQPKVRDFIHMWAEWGDALFWNHGCMGNADELWFEGVCYDLRQIKGLREWYDDMDCNGLNWTDEQWEDFKKKGFAFAQKVRELLPDDIDLYYDWIPYVYKEKDANILARKLIAPKILVPNIKLLNPNEDE